MYVHALQRAQTVWTDDATATAVSSSRWSKTTANEQQVFDFGGMFNDAFLNDASIGPEAAPSQLVLAAAWDMPARIERSIGGAW